MGEAEEAPPSGEERNGGGTRRPTLERFEARFPRTGRFYRRNRILLNTIILVLVTGVVLSLLLGGNLAQVLVSGVVVGSIYVLGATGLSLVYGVKKFANFAHGDLLTLGAYMALLANVGFGLHLLFGFVFSILALAVVGLLLEILIFSRLEGKGVVAPLIASVGLFIIIQNAVSAAFGTEPDAYNIVRMPNWAWNTPFGLVQINPIKGVVTFGVAVAATLFLHITLSRTTLGKSMRAMSDNLELARSSGINTRNVTLWTWALSGMLAALAGVLLGMSLDVRPLLGFSILLFLFAAVIIGGIGSPYGAMVGGFLVGIIQEMSGIVLDWLAKPEVISLDVSAAYRPMAAFMVMILVLLVKPEGLMGVATLKEARGAGLWTRLFRR